MMNILIPAAGSGRIGLAAFPGKFLHGQYRHFAMPIQASLVHKHPMSSERFRTAIEMIDRANGEDPNLEESQGTAVPRELLYSRRMSLWLEKLEPAPSEALKLAARAQHIRRWTVPREQFPEGREGYLRWRTYLYRFHADQAEAILREAGYDDETVGQVRKMISKQGIKRDADVQIIEDAACLVFLEHYFPDFAKKYDERKLIEIVRKTWKKMSDRGHAAAFTLELPEGLQGLVAKALSPNDHL